jgi:hypothetical protein
MTKAGWARWGGGREEEEEEVLSKKMYRAMNEVDAGRDCATVFLSGVIWGFLVMLLCFFVKRCSSGCSWSFTAF